MSQDIFSQAEMERAKAEAKCHCSAAMYEAGENKRIQGILEGLEAENALLRKALMDYDQMKSDHEALALKYKDADQMAERLAAKLDAVNKKYQTMKREHIDLLRNMGLHIDPVGEPGACGSRPIGEKGPEVEIGLAFPNLELCKGGEFVDCSNKSQSV